MTSDRSAVLARLQVSRVSIAATGAPRVEVGDVVAGPGAVFALAGDLLIMMERAGPGAALTGPFRVDAPAEALLLAALEVELSEGCSHLDHTALRSTVAFLVRHGAQPPDCQPGEGAALADPALQWDEANADIC